MYRKDHYRFIEAFKNLSGQELETGAIEKIMMEKFGMASGSVRPNDHADGNKEECPCANTDARVFDRLKTGVYKVRPNLYANVEKILNDTR
jgi:hypothetical protein